MLCESGPRLLLRCSEVHTRRSAVLFLCLWHHTGRELRELSTIRRKHRTHRGTYSTFFTLLVTWKSVLLTLFFHILIIDISSQNEKAAECGAKTYTTRFTFGEKAHSSAIVLFSVQSVTAGIVVNYDHRSIIITICYSY